MRDKCIIILSTKSSGSSACQRLLSQHREVNSVSQTRHFQNETLYWTKAASVLGLPQKRMQDSEVPIEKGKAREDLITLIEQNAGALPECPIVDENFVFEGWRLLCRRYSPVFVEKSPHHLYQWSAVELILKCMKKLPEIDFVLVGLVRNPMDTLYSSWNRRKTDPAIFQHEWLAAYENLLKLKEISGDKLVVIRYEDMVTDISSVKPLLEFMNASDEDIRTNELHKNSVQRWRMDKNFGFQLSEDVMQLAAKFGYRRDEMLNEARKSWPVYRRVSRSLFVVKKSIKYMIPQRLRSRLL